MQQSSGAKNAYQIVLPIFEGPLDLLLHLIRENRLDIYDIPIAEVTDQYLQHISMMESLDLDVAGEFVMMAATLIEIKSRMLLPPEPVESEEEDAIDPRAELVERLIEYQKYREAAEIFRDHESDRMRMFTRGAREFEIDYAPFALADVSPEDLLRALQRMLSDVGEGEQEVTTITRRKISVRMRMSEIWHRVSAASGQLMLFDHLFEEDRNRAEVVITFLAILELLRLRRILVRQDMTFGNIEIVKNETSEGKESDG